MAVARVLADNTPTYPTAFPTSLVERLWRTPGYRSGDGLDPAGPSYLVAGNSAFLDGRGSNIKDGLDEEIITTGNDGYYPIVSGLNSISFTKNAPIDRWNLLEFRASNATSTADVGNVSLVFDDDTELNFDDAVASGDISQFLLINASGISAARLWDDILNIYTGGSTSAKSAPNAQVLLKTTSREIKGLKMNSSYTWSTNLDGFRWRILENGVDYSIEPINDWRRISMYGIKI